MRSHEERLAAVRRRIAEEKRKKLLRRDRIMTACSAAACLALIAGLSALMPGMVRDMAAGGRPAFEMAASMFGGSEAIGYIVIGLISFLLGICVTLLGFCIRRFRRELEAEDDTGDDR